MDNSQYIAGLLRYCDIQSEKGKILDIKKWVLKGMIYQRYDVSKYIKEL